MSMAFLRHGFQGRALHHRISISYAEASLGPIRNTYPSRVALRSSLSLRHYASEAVEPDTSMVVSKQEIIENLPEQDKIRLSRVRNIGISAHIDSGKTTFTERVLFYTGRIKAIHEVRGKDAVGAKMDSMDLEREKGITIQSAATYCDWERVPGDESSDFHFNIIDTPGHIDFTIEVERALRVLDGAVLVVCASSGVQSQTITVDRQMKRYNVPRVTFVNKMDRLGADPWRAIDQLNKKLKIPSAALQVPIGAEDKFEGVIDLIRRKAIYFEGASGEEVVEKDDIPAHLKDLVEEKRSTLIEMLADVDDEIAEIFLMEETPSEEQIRQAIRRATIDLKFNPVLIGSALANKGVQPALDAVCDYLPNPSEVVNTALDQKRDEAPVTMLPYSNKPLVSLAFKLEEGRYGQLTYLRVYQGKLKKGMTITNVKTGKKAKLSRLVRMHSNEMEDVDEVGAGEICATFGVDCSSGDTFCDSTVVYTMTSMYVPEPVVSLSINPTSRETANFSKAIARFQREDPTFRVSYDNESKETIISGMGELHLEIYVERIRREYKVECKTGKPHVAYRETVNKTIDFDFTHKKQSGGAGQYARVAGSVGKLESNANEFEAAITQGKIPEKYLIGCERGFEESCEKGPLTGHRVIGVKMLINDGNTHLVDSSEFAFRLATSGAFRQAFLAADPVVLEPIVEVVVTAPVEFQSGVIGLLNKRGATVSSTEIGTDEFTVTSDCSLNDMFGYASSLRASTQGKGEFSMEFKHYAPAPPQLQKQLMADYEKKLKGDSK